MVDQNSNAPTPPSSSHPDSSQDASASQGLSAPTVVRAGETMLIISLVLIFLVCFFVALHFYLRRQRRRRPRNPRTKKKKEDKAEPQQPELHSQEKNIAELVGTPICEMGESDPRHEMEDAEVHERYTALDLEAQSVGDAVSTSTCNEMHRHEEAEPEIREYALYWSRGL